MRECLGFYCICLSCGFTSMSRRPAKLLLPSCMSPDMFDSLLPPSTYLTFGDFIELLISLVMECDSRLLYF